MSNRVVVLLTPFLNTSIGYGIYIYVEVGLFYSTPMPCHKFTVRNMTKMPVFAQSIDLSVSFHMTENVGIHLNRSNAFDLRARPTVISLKVGKMKLKVLDFDQSECILWCFSV